VKCRGDNTSGELGGGTFSPAAEWIDVLGLSSGASQLAAGADQTCALTNAGHVRCWGRNTTGQLGDGSLSLKIEPPADVAGLTSGVSSLVTGSYHSCARTAAGGAKCWGANYYGAGFVFVASGAVGDGTFLDKPSPVDVIGLTGGVAALAAGSDHTCAVTTSGAAQCWGTNNFGQGGYGSSDVSRATPSAVTGLASGVQSISAGRADTCALLAAGGVKCWGLNSSGQLGDGTTTNRSTPVDVTGLAGALRTANGSVHTCAVLADGGIACWGDNGRGQLGDGTNTSKSQPVRVAVNRTAFTLVVTGGAHTCALTTQGGVMCWGANETGQLGLNSAVDSNVPVDVPGLSSGIVSIGAGSLHTCAVTSAGAVLCWGANDYGQLGDGTDMDRQAPTAAQGIGAPVASITVGGFHTCATTNSGSAKCWGFNRYGQLGRGTATDLGMRPIAAPVLAGPPGRSVNISTRAKVLTGEDVVIAGFIIGGTTPKTVVVRARGPSLASQGVSAPLANPLLQLFSGQTVIATNDDWQSSRDASQIASSGFAPDNPLESAILATLAPGGYTAIVSGAGGGTGVGIVEVFEVNAPDAPLINISTRGKVLTGDDVMISGFIIQGTQPQTVVVRARGPSLTSQGVSGALGDPTLQIYSGQTRIAENSNWQSGSGSLALSTFGLVPPHPLEAAVVMTLDPGAYTAIVSGVGGTTGVAIVEVFSIVQ
jgi:alpha-tubulin suppressor-like RCC1 family protein